MYVWRIAKKQFALDRQGSGARLAGGRWNNPGVAVVYAGMTPEIAAMEKLVHTGDILPTELVLVRIDLPDIKSLYRSYEVEDLPKGWDALPGSSAENIGDSFVMKRNFFGLIVPSAVMSEARNIVLNPNHKAFASVRMNIVRPFEFDSQLFDPLGSERNQRN
ncbi:RES family NAD+ phosphorylase [Ferrovum sp.]|uniref:RES family NAD+ phosphorylase n=1 Tax=Ferrovum sp. TaxID=2609467 RepID=UPI0026375520|nr:RES family NAD+ phosphorylase [Ferrovum sp.]